MCFSSICTIFKAEIIDGTISRMPAEPLPVIDRSLNFSSLLTQAFKANNFCLSAYSYNVPFKRSATPSSIICLFKPSYKHHTNTASLPRTVSSNVCKLITKLQLPEPRSITQISKLEHHPPQPNFPAHACMRACLGRIASDWTTQPPGNVWRFRLGKWGRAPCATVLSV